ncbi:HAD family hydrolase [Microbulbifer thermotolerans]|uniref:HAD family hydrolase n=1 Tax=Microbulbifer thermotolerans TaxID=252514 RepID=UPI00224949A9|nr:HAD family hydrolase [Microbulbifer thermotolerans]MCX2831892.1 HAD hydrolase-like protein [Microbulbifer thermotolerans]
MQSIHDFDVYIFDCDGVILDANRLKIDAMRASLSMFSTIEVNRCLDYFSKNFGKSRYHHVDFFLTEILSVEESGYQQYYDEILHSYSASCRELYIESEFCESVLDFLNVLNAPCYVASGSDQDELRHIFKIKGIYGYFVDILGSPETKSNNIKNIVNNSSGKALMIGDSPSDFYAAKDNEVEFLFYSPYSTAKNEMLTLANKYQFPIVGGYEELL